MRKAATIIIASLVLASGQALGVEGCEFRGMTYPLGEKVAVDRENPETLEWHRAFKKEWGVPPDGSAYKWISCELLVDPEKGDYPAQAERKYVWVSLHQERLEYYPRAYGE